tara:strand:+ start:723 stop:1160 length:438 start_codon:yes stop_codon:yes gene_type:complete
MNYQLLNKEKALLSLSKDEYINKSIKDLFEAESLGFGWVSGIGAVYNIEIGYYDLKKKEYFKRKYPHEHELVSLTANVSFFESNYFVHTHVVVSDEECNSFGGHLFDAQIAVTGEFKIDLIDCRVERKYSDEIGLNLWCLDNENN